MSLIKVFGRLLMKFKDFNAIRNQSYEKKHVKNEADDLLSNPNLKKGKKYINPGTSQLMISCLVIYKIG